MLAFYAMTARAGWYPYGFTNIAHIAQPRGIIIIIHVIIIII